MIKFTTIEIEVQNIRYSTDKKEGRNLNPDYKIEIKLYLFEKIKFFKFDITKLKMERLKLKKSFYQLEQKMIKNTNQWDIKALKALKNLHVELKKIKLKVYLGLEDAGSSAICVGILSTLVANLLRNVIPKNEENFWQIIPIYQNRNLLNINLDCIFRLKLIHIINTIYFIKKKGENYVRTSNRRTYAYSHE